MQRTDELIQLYIVLSVIWKTRKFFSQKINNNHKKKKKKKKRSKSKRKNKRWNDNQKKEEEKRVSEWNKKNC